jgi:hypothetical protein
MVVERAHKKARRVLQSSASLKNAFLGNAPILEKL